MEFLWANPIWTCPYRLPQCPEQFCLSGSSREDSVGCSLWATWHVCWGKASLNTQHIVPWSRLATAEKTTPCQSCQLTTGNWDCNSHWLIKIEQQQSENVARLSLNLCCNMKAQINPSLHQQIRMIVVAQWWGGIFLLHFELLGNDWFGVP